MALFGGRTYVAVDSSAVSAAAVGPGAGGVRVRSFHRALLGPGALAPSPAAANLAGAEEVGEAIRRAVAEVAPGCRRAVLVLPDGIARLLLVEVPAGAEAREFVRFRLAASLPWPAPETLVDVLPVGPGRVAGAAVGRATVAEYERAAKGAGLEVDRVHLAPLLSLEGILRVGRRDAVHVLLGDVALSIVAFRDGAPAVLRSRRRDRSGAEAAWILEEAARAAALAGDGSAPPRVALSGSGATRLGEELPVTALERGLTGPAAWPQAAEAAWLAGVVR